MILLLDAGYHAVTFVSQVLSGHMCHYSMLCYVMYTRSDYFIMDNSMPYYRQFCYWMLDTMQLHLCPKCWVTTCVITLCYAMLCYVHKE